MERQQFGAGQSLLPLFPRLSSSSSELAPSSSPGSSGCSMQNGLCLRAVAWNKTKKGLGRPRMLALSQLPSTLSWDVVAKKLKESVWLQISNAKWSTLATSTRFGCPSSSPLLSIQVTEKKKTCQRRLTMDTILVHRTVNTFVYTFLLNWCSWMTTISLKWKIDEYRLLKST